MVSRLQLAPAIANGARLSHRLDKVLMPCALMHAQSKDARARLRGPGLLVLDRSVRDVVDTEGYVVVDGGKCQLVEGSAMGKDADVVGQVLFCCRPPQPMLGASAETSELIQL